MTQEIHETKRRINKNIWQRLLGRSHTSPLQSLLISGCILELFYLLLAALAPLPGLHLASTPLANAWPWTLALSQLLFPGALSPTNRIPGHDWFHLSLLSFALLTLTAIYMVTLIRLLPTRVGKIGANPSGSSPAPTSLRWLLLVLAGTLLFSLTLLLQPSLFSDDVFSYIFSGRILTIYHADPLNNAPLQFSQDQYLQWVISGRNTPNIYGPLWLCIASVLVGIGNGLASLLPGPVITLLLFKSVALLSHLINCLLLWAILGKIAPTRRLLGTFLYAWNPLAIIELAGSGHYEGILLGLLLLATLLYISGKERSPGTLSEQTYPRDRLRRYGIVPWREIGVLILLGLAISLNLIALLIAPLFAWFAVRNQNHLPRALWGFIWRTLLGQGFVLLIYLPFWRGATTFFAITSAIDMQHFVHSPLGLLSEPTRWLFGLIAQWSQFPPVMQPTTAADVTLRASSIFIFALIYLDLFGKVRHAPTTLAGMRYSSAADQHMLYPGFDVLLNSWNSAVFWYLVLVLGWFWPWYVLWILWIAAMRPIDRYSMSILLLAGTALLTYPLLDFVGSPFAPYQPVLIFGIPLFYLIMNRNRHVERSML